MQKKILIIDDNRNMVIPLEYFINHAGYEVQSTFDGEDALERIPQFKPDLLLLDIILPGIDGYDVCQQVRENPKWSDILIIMVTAKGREVEVTKGLAMGANAYITKPFSAKDLLVEIDSLFNAHESLTA